MTPEAAKEVAAMRCVMIIPGSWLVIAPFVLGYTAHPQPLVNDVLVGILVIALGG